jgi:lipid A 4'-phosphatase
VPDREGDRAPTARDWRRDLAAFVVIGLAVTILFAATPLDFATIRIFYRPDPVNHWPFTTKLPWSVLYRLAPWITASLVLAGLAGLAAGLVRRRDMWRRRAVFVLLSVVLGPGILINAVFKDHWGRPRPREVVEFGGTMPYAVAPLRGEGGASFPCGHCSVGFLYALGWWIWRRERPGWAVASLATGTITGTALGLGRMAAGGHFLSDAVWSALIALGVAHALYHYVLRLPAHEAGAVLPPAAYRPQRGRQGVLAALSAFGGLAVLAAVFIAPHGTQIGTALDLSKLPRPPEAFEVSARTANIEIVIADSAPGRVSISGELHGFGLPNSRLRDTTRFVEQPTPTLEYRIEQRGWFTDLSGSATIRVPAAAFRRIRVSLGRGDIEVTDATRTGVVASGAIKLDLRTGSGHVRKIRVTIPTNIPRLRRNRP